MAEATTISKTTVEKLAQQLRVDSIRSTTEAGSGHPTSCMSAADLMAVLMTQFLKFDFKDPHFENNDRLIFSKGHAAPLLYSMYKAAGAITDEELMSLRKIGSRLEGHPVPEILPYVDVATGSLGQGLSMGVGMALSAKYLDKLNYKVWVLLGDSEMAEGSVWEAMQLASHYKLDNIVAILDMNRLGQRGETALGWNSGAYAQRARAFGWNTVEINGHNFDEITKAYEGAIATLTKPTMIIAKTDKGHGLPLTENKDNWHGKPLSKEECAEALKALGANDIRVDVAKPQSSPKSDKVKSAVTNKFVCPDFKGEVATREAYGEALKALGDAFEDVVVLDAETSNSTFADKFGKAHMDRFFEIYIAEQAMVGVACGLSTRNKAAYASSFAAFLARAYDFIRMGAVSRTNIKLCGSHAGCSIGQDGPSQMALEDLASIRAVLNSTVLYPSDAYATAHLVNTMRTLKGTSYIRTTRAKTPLLYSAKEEFPIGGSKVLKKSKEDQVTLIGAGITLHECLKAYEELKSAGINARVIDLYSIKPVDVDTLRKAAAETGKFVTVEDHAQEGGIGDAVLGAFASTEKEKAPQAPLMVKLAVREVPGSGTPEELMDIAGITAKHIVAAAKSLLK